MRQYSREELKKLLNEYMDACVSPDEKGTVKNMLTGNEKFCLMSKWQETSGDLAEMIKLSVQSYSYDKGTAIRRYRSLTAWLERKHGIRLQIEWPPIDVNSHFERTVYMLRMMQTKPDHIADLLADKLWRSTRSIEDELSDIIHPDVTTQDNSILKQSFQINGIIRDDGAIDFPSSVHPILLLENLTCVIVLLQSLLEKAADPLYKGWALITASRIWSQLTDYARDKVKDFLFRSDNGDERQAELFRQMEQLSGDTRFRTEEEICREACDQLLYAMKTRALCKILYEKEPDNMETLIGRVVSCKKDTVELRLQNGETRLLKTVKIHGSTTV